jgi:hypothetical protein
MLIEAFRGDSGFSRQRAQLEQIVDRYPDYWPAWWALGDGLLHNYPHIGSTADDTRKALERVVTLNPVMVTAWEHLLWAASDQRDTAMQARALERLERLHAGPTILQNERMDKLLAYRTVLALQRRSLESEVMLDSMYQDVLRPGRDKFVPGIVLQGSGMPAAQIDFNRRLLRHGLAPEDARNVAHGIALAWAMRGSWDSALVARDHLVQSATDTLGLLNVYRTAVLATFVGALPAQEAARRRPAVARLVPFQPAGYQAELAWLDGVLAAANRGSVAPVPNGQLSSIGRSARSIWPCGASGALPPPLWPRWNGSSLTVAHGLPSIPVLLTCCSAALIGWRPLSGCWRKETALRLCVSSNGTVRCRRSTTRCHSGLWPNCSRGESRTDRVILQQPATIMRISCCVTTVRSRPIATWWMKPWLRWRVYRVAPHCL